MPRIAIRKGGANRQFWQGYDLRRRIPSPGRLPSGGSVLGQTKMGSVVVVIIEIWSQQSQSMLSAEYDDTIK